MKKREKIIITYCVICLLWHITAFPTSASPRQLQQDTPLIKVVNPLTKDENFIIQTNETLISAKFNATVWIYNVEDLFAYQVKLNINDTWLNITSAWVPKGDPNWVFDRKATVGLKPCYYDNDNDGLRESVLIGDSLLKGAETFSGSGLLGIVEFKIVNTPTVNESVNLTIELSDTIILNSSLAIMPHTIVNGNYKYTRIPLPSAWLEASPSNIQFSCNKIAVGKRFNVTIFLKNLNPLCYLINASFFLKFNPHLINLLDYTKEPAWNRVNIAFENDGISISLTNPTQNLYGNISLITLTFQIIYQANYPVTNETTLEIVNASLFGFFQKISLEPSISSKIIIEGLLPKPWLEVSPSNIYIRSAPPSSMGQNFTVNIIIKNLDALWKLKSITLTLTFNQTLLRILNIAEGTFLPSFNPTTFEHVISDGEITINESFTNYPTLYPSGEGTIATIVFQIIYQGPPLQMDRSNITITKVNLRDIDRNIIPVDTNKILHGLYQIKSLKTSTISLTANATSVKIGTYINLSGVITPRISNVNVTIFYRKQNEEWAALTTIKTNSTGYYTYAWKVTQTGTFQIKASWLGDANYEGAESNIITLIVEQETPSMTPTYILGALILLIIFSITMYYIVKKKHFFKASQTIEASYINFLFPLILIYFGVV
jgi:hypothetical protein